MIARERLVQVRQDLVNLIRGLLKPFGILTGRLGSSRLDARVRELAADRPLLLAALDPLLTIRLRILDEIELLDEQLLGLAKGDAVCRRLMTIPGVGHLTVRTFLAVIDDPGRFRSSQQVGAYLGLVPPRWRSGEVDQAGRITRRGDGLLRHLLHERANAILSTLEKPCCGPKAWAAERPEARRGAKRARVAPARKPAVLMQHPHRLRAKGQAHDSQRQPRVARPVAASAPAAASRPRRLAAVAPPGRGQGWSARTVPRRQPSRRPRRGPRRGPLALTRPSTAKLGRRPSQGSTRSPPSTPSTTMIPARTRRLQQGMLAIRQHLPQLTQLAPGHRLIRTRVPRTVTNAPSSPAGGCRPRMVRRSAIRSSAVQCGKRISPAWSRLSDGRGHRRPCPSSPGCASPPLLGAGSPRRPGLAQRW